MVERFDISCINWDYYFLDESHLLKCIDSLNIINSIVVGKKLIMVVVYWTFALIMGSMCYSC